MVPSLRESFILTLPRTAVPGFLVLYLRALGSGRSLHRP
jgi:hypothetical protein